MKAPDVQHFTAEPAPEGSAGTRAGERPVDVLILTALEDELSAVLALGDGWSEWKDRGGFPYRRREFAREDGKRPLVVAAAWLGKMGEVATAIRGGDLLRELDAACVAMCGICAGRRGEVALGDVIVADRLYSYDHGKIIAEPGKAVEFHHDIETHSLHPLWKMGAANLKREIDLLGLQKHRPLSKEAQRRWLLHALYAHEAESGPAPVSLAERKTACPGWSHRIQEAIEDKLLTLDGGGLSLTPGGRKLVLDERMLYPDGLPEDPSLRVHVGAVATGKTVQKDPDLFKRLERLVRTTIGVEMEGAAIGELARYFDKRGIVVKAVSDHGDLNKDDGFRKFACRASAEVLMAFLQKHLEIGRDAGAREQEPGDRDERVRGLRRDLEAAHSRKQRLVALRGSTDEVDVEILRLRRALRAGGQLHEGDALGDGRYTLVRRIGKGGFAIVWEAHDEVRDERVALKVLHPELARDATRLERFFRGAREMAELKHEAVVRVLERCGEDDGWHYFVMEFVPGGDLRRAVLDGRLSAEDVLSIVARVGDALAAAHAKGLIHRDVKPANILLDAAGAPRLTDFDLVAAADTTGGTRTGAMGTFVYAAPEQLDRPQDVDARVDVYGLGMTAVFALYGRELPVTIMKHGDRVLDGLSCGAAVKEALKKAIEWERDARFADVLEFCETLRQATARSRMRIVGARGTVLDRLAAAVGAPPGRGDAEPMWTPASGCNAVAWSRSGDLVASGHDDGAVRLWDAANGKAIRTLAGHAGVVRSVAFSPDGHSLASGADDQTVRLWDVPTGRTVHACEGHTNWVMSVAFSPDGHSLASGSYDQTMRLWEVASGRAVRAFEGHSGLVMSVAFSPNGHSLVSGSDDKTVHLWEVASRRAVRVFKGHTDGVRSVVFSPDGHSLASGSDDQTVRLWEVASGRAVRTFEGHSGLVMSVAFSPDGYSLASGSDDKTVRLWEVASGRAVHAFEGHSGLVMSIAFSPDGAILVSASDDQTVRLWEVASGRAVRAFEGHSGLVMSVAFSPDGHTVASGSHDKTVRLWEVASGRAVRAFEGHSHMVRNVAFSPDGHILASGSYDETVRLWDVASGGAVRVLEGHTNAAMSVAFSPDGHTLASGSDDQTVHLWEVASGRVVRAFKGHTDGVMSVAFSPDGHTLASGSYDETVRLWEIASRRAVCTFEGHSSLVMSVAFSPDGHTLASGSSDRTVRLWEVATGRAVRSFEGHTGWVMSVAFSPDGHTLASGSSDNTVRLWDVATGRCLAILLPCPEGWAAFTPDGRYKLGGDIGGSFWHVIGLCRFEPGELDPYYPHLRIPDDEPLIAVPPARLPTR